MSRNTISIFFIIFIGFLLRIYLARIFPLWHDEAFSIWASQHSINQIIKAATDSVHPPGYYLLLHLWGKISDHLYWLRSLSIIAFVFNAYLLKKIGERIKILSLPLLLVFLYSFSGYFIIFDWQVRMYSIVVTFILLSLLILDTNINNRHGQKLIPWIFFTIINTVGLYIDYSYFWYFIPLVLFIFIFSIVKKSRKYFLASFSLFISGLLFLLIHPSLISTYGQGIAGIVWAKPYFSPTFFIPYFLGTHKNTFFTVILLIFSSLGLNTIIHRKPFSLIVAVLLFSSGFSLCSTFVYSLFISPIFHVRSLQVVGIAIIVLLGFSIDNFRKRFRTHFILLLCTIMVMNFALILQIFPRSPGQFLVSFFPWKRIINTLDTNNTKIIRYRETFKKLPTPLLLWGLQYTLNGKESYPIRKIQFEEFELTTKDEECVLFYNNLLELYSCKPAN